MDGGVIIGLRWCYLGIKILNKIMLIMNNWLEDPKLGCVVGEGFKTIEKYMDVEDNMLEENEELITYILILILRFELD
jgi:hypothetical protein